jgi:methionyl-tRNA synthetase
MSTAYVTTSIPYVNGEPHVGFGLELVQADVVARHRRLRGHDVRFLTGTDDNALKNVRVAEAAGVPVRELVDRNARRFETLARLLRASNDDFIRTSVDPRHAPGVERLWRACADDLYEREYEGLYCVRCESFVTDDHEHPGLERVAERNWFFRLSRYEADLLELLESGGLHVEPDVRRNEVLALARGGLQDFSISRSRDRAHGWGIPVPDDPAQIVYVWFDALANYVTALGYGGDDALLGRYWSGSDARIHTIGKDIVRFHAVYWPAILLSAGLPLPTTIWVHDFVTADGARLSKSAGGAPAAAELVERFGVDALRWWLLRESKPGSDLAYRDELVVERANAELANTIGNLISRTARLVARHGLETGPAASTGLAERIDAALERFDFRAATEELLQVAVAANRLVEETRPWERRPDSASATATLAATCRELAAEVEPFLPGSAERIEAALAGSGGRVFPRLEEG